MYLWWYLIYVAGVFLMIKKENEKKHSLLGASATLW